MPRSQYRVNVLACARDQYRAGTLSACVIAGNDRVEHGARTQCNGNKLAGPSRREVENSKPLRSNAPSALLICTTMRLWQARNRPW